MVHLTQKTDANGLRHLRRTEPSWLWLVLIGGSVAVHALTAFILLPLIGRISPQPPDLEIDPIDFVELPQPNTSTAGGATAIVSTPPISPSTPIPPSPTQPQPSDINIAPLPNPPTSPSPPVTPPPEPPSPQPPAPNPQPPVSTPPSPQSPLPTPPTPLIQTFSINTRPPDVSETLSPPPETVDPSQLAQVNTSQRAEPVSLTASLQIVPLPPEAAETPLPETIAQPKDTVEGVSRYTFKADPQISPCIPDAVAAQSIGTGTTAAIQVVTDAQGQVTEAVLRQSSQNPAYDDLALCLVKNWGYEPAIAQAQPVPSQALMVLVQIDRSETSPDASPNASPDTSPDASPDSIPNPAPSP